MGNERAIETPGEPGINAADRRPIRSRGSRWAGAFAERLAKAGVTPNAISTVSIVFALAGASALVATRYETGFESGLWLIAAVMIVFRLLANLFDGMVAERQGGASSVGELFNEVPDRLSDVAFLIATGYASGGSPELGFGAAMVAVFVTYSRVAIRLAGAPMDFRGPMAKQQRMHILIAVAVVMAAAPDLVSWGPNGDYGVPAIGLGLIIIGGLYTAARRLNRSVQYLRG